MYLAAFFLVLALGSFGLSSMRRNEGQTLRISCDGRTAAELSLSQIRTGKSAEKARYCLLLYREEGISCEWYDSQPELAAIVPAGVSYNLLAVSASGVSMESADCPDQICVHHIPISGAGESIICLPHKLAVEITGSPEWKE